MDPAVQARDGLPRSEGQAGQSRAIHAGAAEDSPSPVAEQRRLHPGKIERPMPEDVRIDASCALFYKDPGDRAFAAADASGKTDHEAFHRRRIRDCSLERFDTLGDVNSTRSVLERSGAVK